VLRHVARFASPDAAVGAGSLLAPMPGVLARLEVGAGERVEQGQVVVIVESMKMEHPVRAPLTGTVAEILVRPGQQVETGAVLVVVTPDDETPAD
jgi:propionyl-CoA carboxylase alpha chain